MSRNQAQRIDSGVGGEKSDPPTRETNAAKSSDDLAQRGEERGSGETAAQPEVLTANEVAALLRINPKTVRELFHAGELPGRKLGPKIIRFPRSEVLKWLSGEDRVSRTSRRRR